MTIPGELYKESESVGEEYCKFFLLEPFTYIPRYLTTYRVLATLEI